MKGSIIILIPLASLTALVVASPLPAMANSVHERRDDTPTGEALWENLEEEKLPRFRDKIEGPAVSYLGGVANAALQQTWNRLWNKYVSPHIEGQDQDAGEARIEAVPPQRLTPAQRAHTLRVEKENRLKHEMGVPMWTENGNIVHN